jgi:hypothetical protein
MRQDTKGRAMPKFLLILEEEDREATLTGRTVSKMFKNSVIPRIGEEVTIRGNGYPITNVDHRLESSTGKPLVIVYAKWWSGDFELLWEDESWDNYGKL